jgi:hypothetical protein
MLIILIRARGIRAFSLFSYLAGYLSPRARIRIIRNLSLAWVRIFDAPGGTTTGAEAKGEPTLRFGGWRQSAHVNGLGYPIGTAQWPRRSLLGDAECALPGDRAGSTVLISSGEVLR